MVDRYEVHYSSFCMTRCSTERAYLRSTPLLQQLILRQQLLARCSLHVMTRSYPSGVLVELTLLLCNMLCVLIVTLCMRYFVSIIQILLLNVRDDLVPCASDDLAG